jgi:hypothetical protein
MTPKEFVSWVLQTIAFLNSQKTGYSLYYLPYFLNFIQDVLCVYNPESTEFLEGYHDKSDDERRLSPITVFSQLVDFLSQTNRLSKDSIMVMSECITRSVVWLGCTPAVIARQFIQSNFAFEMTQDYIRVFTLLNQFMRYGYNLMYKNPELLLKAIRYVVDVKKVTPDELEREQWVQGIYFNALPILHNSMIEGIVTDKEIQ